MTRYIKIEEAKKLLCPFLVTTSGYCSTKDCMAWTIQGINSLNLKTKEYEFISLDPKQGYCKRLYNE